MSAVRSEVRASTLTWRMPHRPWTLRGFSRSTAATSFTVPELGIVVDAGTKVHKAHPSHILVTHTHDDHTYELPRMRSRRKPPVIAVPEHAVGLVDGFLDAALRLTASQELPPDFRWTPSYDLVGVAPGARLSLGRDLVADVVRCDHSVPCVGYLVSRVREKLLSDYADMSGPEIGALRAAGETVTQRVASPEIAFLGDTTPQVFDWHPELLQAPVVVVECTFLAPEHRAAAHDRKHTHVDDLWPLVQAHPDTHFVLTHFSLRYSEAKVRAFFGERPHPNVTVFV